MSGALFIVFEGIDGAGTTTQCEFLSGAIEKRGHPVVCTREPGGTPLAERIRGLVLDSTGTPMHAMTELFLYAAGRLQHVHELIRPALEAGKHVICDRFTGSTWAYQGYGRKLNLEVVGRVTEMAEGGCSPDLTIYLELPVEAAAQRRLKRGQAPDRLEQEGEAFHRCVAQAYREIARQQGDKALILDATRPAHELAVKIWDELERRWPRFPFNQGSRES